MPNIKVKGQSGNILTYEGVERVLFDSADDSESTIPFIYGDVTELAPVVLDLGDGDQKVTAPNGTLVREVTIAKPATLLPENIRRNVSVAGVVGTMVGDTEEVTVELDFPASTTETEVLAEQTVDGFAPDESMGGAYSSNVIGDFAALVVGQKYTVMWDAKEYTCTAVDVSAMQAGGVALGELSGVGGGGNGEPFIVMSVPFDGGALYGFLVVDGSTAASHTVCIYQVVNGGNADMVVEPSEEGKTLSKVTVKKPEALIPSNIANGVEIGGVTGEFIGDTEETTVDLNFAKGDQEVIPSADGKVMSKVTIQKPETLIPDNIVKNVVIAGVTGAYSGGVDFDPDIKYFMGTVDPDNRQMVLRYLDVGKYRTEKGTNNVSIPNTVGGFDVCISSVKGVSASLNFFNNGCYYLQNITIGEGVRYFENSMANLFYYCQNFNSPIPIPNEITNLFNTFSCCNNFNQPVTIPNGVTNMAGTFIYCNNFNQPVTIPNGVTNMCNTFYSCSKFNQPVHIPSVATNLYQVLARSNFNQPITIPDSVTYLRSALDSCSHFNQPITWGNPVASAYNMLYRCYNFNQPVVVPNTITNVVGMFTECNRLNSPIVIGSGVNNLQNTFAGCTNLSGNIYIFATEITNVMNALSGRKSTSPRLNLFVPAGSVTNTTIYGNTAAGKSMVYTSMSWVAYTNYYYSSSINVYVYYNGFPENLI